MIVIKTILGETFAAKTLDEAIDIAHVADDPYFYFGEVESNDPGMARLITPEEWQKATSAGL